jgi:HlyD family secretion protein
MKVSHSSTRLILPVALATVLAVSGIAATKPSAKTSAKADEAAPATYTVARGALRPRPQVDAVFQAAAMQAFKLEPKAWADLTVVEVVPHGARVKKGDALLKLDLDKLREQIEDTEKDRPVTALALDQATAELANLEQATPLRLESARRTARISDEDLAYFENVGRVQREKNSRFSLTNAEYQLEAATEELKQLEKMYKRDDLVEETEEFIMKRQRHAVEAAQFSLAFIRTNSERELKVTLPREADTLKNAQREQSLALTLAEETQPKTLAKKRLDVEKMKRDQKKAEKRLADLKTDLETLPLRAPFDGVVYYGACEGGKWTTGPVVAKKLAPGMKLAPQEILLTVVDPDKLLLKAVVAEADLPKFRQGLGGQAAPVAAPDKKLAVKLEEIGLAPQPGGGFEATFSMSGDKPSLLMPGMSAKVTLGETTKPDALLAPTDAVATEGAQKFVWLMKADGKTEKREVKTGESENQKVEILEGLAEGDKILAKAPAGK